MEITLPAWVHQHLTLIVVLAWVASNFVVAMPAPTEKSGPLYKWMFGSLHGIFGAIPRVVATMWPGAAKWFTFGNGQEPPKQ